MILLGGKFKVVFNDTYNQFRINDHNIDKLSLETFQIGLVFNLKKIFKTKLNLKLTE